MADFWDELFDDPILLPDGGKLITLRDAGDYIARLPKTLHDSDRWQLAIKDNFGFAMAVVCPRQNFVG